jgi:pseudomonalisin
MKLVFARKALFSNRLTIALSLALAAAGTASAASSIRPGSAAPAWAPTNTSTVDFDRAEIRGSVEDNYPVSIVVNLKLRNEEAMDSFIKELHRPGSPAFHQWLSSEQATANFSSTQEQAQAVADYLSAQGFTNVKIAANRLLVSADGSVGAARRAFNTDFAHVSLNGEEGIANTRSAQVPAAIADQVHSVLGLQTVQKLHTHLAGPSRSLGTNSLPAGHSATRSVYLPSDLQTVYHVGTTPTGNKTAAAVIGWGDMSSASSNVAQYESDAGLAKVPVNVVAVGATLTDDPNADVEWAMDATAIIGMSGGVKSLTLYEGDSNANDANIGVPINRAVTDNIAKVVNMSFGECDGAGGETSGPWDTYFKTGVTQGMTFSASSGDTGAYSCGTGGQNGGAFGSQLGASYPASSPYVISVGGTTLNTDVNSNYISESTWGQWSGGGVSTFEAKPAWQSALSGNFRQVPDIAFDGDPNTGMIFYMASQGGYVANAGTSLASPLFVGAWARLETANNNGLGFAPPALYAYSATFPFHDVTTGNNGHYNAGVGYDNVTGWGSFDIQAAATFITNNPGFVADTNGGGGGNTGGTPSANFTFSTSGLTATFTDSSTDSGGTIGSHSWTFGDGASATTTSPSHTYAAAGTYSVSETVTDSVSGKTNSKTQSVTVASAGGTPTANFSVVTNGLTATFTDSSTDSGGTIGSRSWTFGDGSTSTAASPSHTYAAAGTYSVSETVKDSVSGKTSSKTSSVTVNSSGGGHGTFSNNTPYVINDYATVTSGIAVTGISGNGPATLQVHVNITHNWTGDLQIAIIAPDGTSAVLKYPDYYTNLGTLNTTYNVTLNGPLAVANGTWKLQVIDSDYGYGDYGTLNSWSLTF